MKKLAFLVVLLVGRTGFGQCDDGDCQPVPLFNYITVPFTPVMSREDCQPWGPLEISIFAEIGEGDSVRQSLRLDGFPETWTWSYLADTFKLYPTDTGAAGQWSPEAAMYADDGSYISTSIFDIVFNPESAFIVGLIGETGCNFRETAIPYRVSGPATDGDSNRDGVFDSSDLVQVFVGGKYETGLEASWEEGDWDWSGTFQSGDFTYALTFGSYETQAATAAVPEPTAAWLLGVGVVLLRWPTRMIGRRGRR
jgi:hypothetical protein